MQISQQQTNDMAAAYRQTAVGNSASQPMLNAPIVTYSTADWLFEHKTTFYIMMAVTGFSAYYLVKYQSMEPPIFIRSE